MTASAKHALRSRAVQSAILGSLSVAALIASEALAWQLSGEVRAILLSVALAAFGGGAWARGKAQGPLRWRGTK